MTNMDQLNSRIKIITNELKQYVETRIDLMVLNFGEQISSWFGESIQKIIGCTIMIIGLFFTLIGLAIYLGELLENLFLGYIIVGLPLILIGLLLASMKPKGVAKSIQNQFMEVILKSLDKRRVQMYEQVSESKQKELTQGNE